jgi:hypothetical protein
MRHLMTLESFYDDTSWTRTIDGREVTITIHDLQRYLDDRGVPVTEVPVYEIFHLCAHKDKTDRETISRSDRSDLSYPIIVARDRDGIWTKVLDGMHRLLKARNKGLDAIRARVLDLSDAPDDYKFMFG